MQFLQTREHQRPQCAGDLDFEEMGCRARERVSAQQRVGQDVEVLDRDGLDPEVERARLPGSIDPRFNETEELVKDAILQGDRQREEPIEPALDRRKIVDHRSVGSFDPESRQFLEPTKCYGVELAGEQ